MSTQESTVVRDETTTLAWIHLHDTPEPVEVALRFGGHSFEYIASVLKGDMHPSQVDCVTFGHITPELENRQSSIVVECATLQPIFEFGHELMGGSAR